MVNACLIIRWINQHHSGKRRMEAIERAKATESSNS